MHRPVGQRVVVLLDAVELVARAGRSVVPSCRGSLASSVRDLGAHPSPRAAARASRSRRLRWPRRPTQHVAPAPQRSSQEEDDQGDQRAGCRSRSPAQELLERALIAPPRAARHRRRRGTAGRGRAAAGRRSAPPSRCRASIATPWRCEVGLRSARAWLARQVAARRRSRPRCRARRACAAPASFVAVSPEVDRARLAATRRPACSSRARSSAGPSGAGSARGCGYLPPTRCRSGPVRLRAPLERMVVDELLEPRVLAVAQRLVRGTAGSSGCGSCSSPRARRCRGPPARAACTASASTWTVLGRRRRRRRPSCGRRGPASSAATATAPRRMITRRDELHDAADQDRDAGRAR